MINKKSKKKKEKNQYKLKQEWVETKYRTSVKSFISLSDMINVWIDLGQYLGTDANVLIRFLCRLKY